DGVSNMARAFAPLLAANGAERQIVTLHTHETLRAETIPFESIVWRPEDAVIVHVWNTTRLEAFLRAFPGRKAIFFQNITPPEFFEPGSECCRETEAAWRQLPRLAELADIWLAPSAFNLSALAAVARTPRPRYVVPAPVDPRQERARPVDPGRLATLKSHHEVNILFVGRLAPHEATERRVEVFDRYPLRINRRSRL